VTSVTSPLEINWILFSTYFRHSYGGGKFKSTHQLHGAEAFLRSRQLCSYSRSSQNFMEPEGSLPCSQEPSTGPYPQPDGFSSHHPILRSILVISTHLRLGLPSGLFPSGFSTNILYAYLFSPFVLHALVISSSLT
jgi:hypothetical protein